MSYMNDNVLLNLLNELGKPIKCEACFIVFPNEVNKTGAGTCLLHSLYRMIESL